MKHLSLLVACFLLFQGYLVAGDGNYAVSRISKSLLKNANAVLRFEEIRFEVVSPKETIYKHHYVVTIMNEKGDRWAEFYEYYDKHRSIADVSGTLYDAAGKQLKKIKKKDLIDLSGVSSGTLMDDDRIKRHNFYYRVYPYTVEYEVEVVNKSSLFFPMWAPQGGEHLSVEYSSVSMVSDPSYEIRYKAFMYDGQPVMTRQKSKKVMTWTAKNMQAVSRELYSPMWHELSTVVLFGPSEFQMDSYKGNMKTWQDFGRFVHSLRQGRDQLPDNIKSQVRSLISDASNDREKVRRLYEYMQKNTRYISIQLGIGGWQPFPAKDVAANGYGDCKALTNYMYSLLKEAGINSYYTLVRAGQNATYLTEDFPSQQFNHVILCVPLAKDTVWLECTSQTMPAGYLGDFTCDRPALLIDEDGGKMIRTPRYNMNENLQVRRLNTVLSANGTIQIKAANQYTGIQQDNIHSLINSMSKEKVKEHLEEGLDFSTYDVNAFDYSEQKTALPVINESLDVTVSNYATVTGKRLFIVPNVMTRWNRKLSADSTRKYDLMLPLEYRDIDTVTIELPGGYTPETMPKDISINSRFGSYSSSVKLEGSKLIYYRIMEHRSGRFPAKDYNDLVAFYNEIHKADRSRVVLVGGNTEKKAF